MAMRACTHCGNQVATTSKICPYCRKNPVNWLVRTTLKLIVFGFVGAMGLIVVAAVLKQF